MSRHLRCLVIHRSPQEASRLAGWLGEVGHRAQTAPSTSAGLELLQTHDFDLVLVEMPHPASEGPEFFRMVREELAREDTAVVFLGPEPPEEALARLDTLAVVPPHCDKRRVTRIADWLVDGSQAAPPLPQKDFERFAHHLERVSGLIFEPKRRTTLEDALRRRMRLVGAEDFEIYYGRLAAGPHARAEEHRLVHLLTIGETSFFRNHAHFEVLREELLPRIRREQERELRRVRLWSAGCSTGEEPYTLAMVALDVFPDAEKWDLRVLATDINLRSLATARRGVYSERALRTTPGSYVDRHFHKESEGRYLIGERVRNLVRFDQVNLASGPYPDRNHAVMCRNVLIYFRREGYVDVVRRIRDSLVPGGALFLGHSETLMGLDLGFQTVQAHHTYYYRKPALDDHLDSTAPQEPASPMEPAADRNPPPRPRQSHPAPHSTSAALDRLAATSRAALPTAPGAVRTPARRADSRHSLSEATREFDGLLQGAAGSATELVGRGFLAANRGDWEQARECATEALSRDSLLAEGHFLMGVLQSETGDASAAAESFKRALFLNPDLPMAHYHLAHIRARENRLPDARREFENAIELLERGIEPLFTGGFPPEQLITICRQSLAKLPSRKES